MYQSRQQLQILLEPVITAMGYELIGVEFTRAHSGGLLRVYIDQAAGITLEDCQQVSQQISSLLDVEDVITGHYTLEVSSPGLDRPLFEAKHYQQFVGHKIRLKLVMPVADRRQFTGLLKGMQGADVIVEVDGEDLRVALDQVEKARLVPDL